MQSPPKTIKNIETRVKVLERVLCKEIIQKEALFCFRLSGCLLRKVRFV